VKNENKRGNNKKQLSKNKIIPTTYKENRILIKEYINDINLNTKLFFLLISHEKVFSR